ncbi:MAG: DUF3291 domain-containing protein [Gammaproteobacteria bacterium]|nr:DUF3291 domain-containing protein [Gammaproteobacteria bacterium]
MFNLAQLNIAKMKFSLEDPRVADFVNALDRVNASAEASTGFVWRLQTEEGDVTAVQIHDGDLLLVNMSVWESIDHLKAFVSSREHLEIMGRRGEWFDPADLPYLVLWWIPAGQIPTVDEAQGKLDRLREHGPSEHAFNFSAPYPPPSPVKLERQLQTELGDIQERIRNYPQPITACDEQFNWLLDERERVSTELARIDG